MSVKLSQRLGQIDTLITRQYDRTYPSDLVMQDSVGI